VPRFLTSQESEVFGTTPFLEPQLNRLTSKSAISIRDLPHHVLASFRNFAPRFFAAFEIFALAAADITRFFALPRFRPANFPRARAAARTQLRRPDSRANRFAVVVLNFCPHSSLAADGAKADCAARS
jgi:hypothetical protein